MTESTSVEDWVPRHFRWALALLVVTTFLFGLTSSAGELLQILAALAMASAVTLVCMLDAKMHGKTFVRTFGLALFMTWPLGVLVHLIWTRRGPGVVLYILLVAGFAVVTGAGYGVAALLAGLRPAPSGFE